MVASEFDNLWEHTTGPLIGTDTLDGDSKVDVVVIGGGFTGCTAALYLAEAGADVCLLEAATIGFGGSGRSVGLVNAGLWLEPEQVEARLGTGAGDACRQRPCRSGAFAAIIGARHASYGVNSLRSSSCMHGTLMRGL